MQPFIRNHDYNFIKKQAGQLQHVIRTNADPKVIGSVKSGTEAKIAERFVVISDEHRQLLTSVVRLETSEDFAKYGKSLEPHILPFPEITAKQLQKLFPKNKKLKLPDLAAIDCRFITYLGWIDIATTKLFIVYNHDSRITGVEGRFTPTHKKGYCFVCNRLEEVALFTAISKKRPANASSDYYKAIGNYICMNSMECNKNITELAPLEKFIQSVNE